MSAANDAPLQTAAGQSAVGGAFDVISRARHALRAGSNVSTNTAIDYSKKVKLVLNEFAIAKQRGDKASLKLILARYAPRPSSFRAMRSALVWNFKLQAQKLLKEQDLHQRMKPRPDTWLPLISQLDQTLKIISVLEGYEAEELITLTGGQSRIKHSKKKDLAKMPRDWKQQMVARGLSSPLYGMPLAITAAMGCRPSELLQGVTLCLDGQSIIGRCLGSKLTQHSGQPWREVKFLEGALPPGTKEKISEAGGTLIIKIAKTSNFKAHLTRISKSLWPDKPNMTSYAFRHLFTEDLRKSGWSAEEIGGALGHLVANTQSHYGRKVRTGKKTPSSSFIEQKSIKTALPVRALDRSGLTAIKKINLKTSNPKK